MVERREVVVVELDLRALGDLETEPEEDVLDLAPRLGDQVQPAGLARRVAGQRHVDAILGQTCVQLSVLELAGATADQLLELLPHGVRGLADPSALLRRQVTDRAQRRGELRLAPEVLDARVLELLDRRSGGHVLLRLGADLVERVSHSRPSYVRARTAPRSRPSPRSASPGRRRGRGCGPPRGPLSARRAPALPARLPPSRPPARPARSPEASARRRGRAPAACRAARPRRRAPAGARRSSPCPPARPSRRTGRRTAGRRPPARHTTRGLPGRSCPRCPDPSRRRATPTAAHSAPTSAPGTRRSRAYPNRVSRRPRAASPRRRSRPAARTRAPMRHRPGPRPRR